MKRVLVVPRVPPHWRCLDFAAAYAYEKRTLRGLDTGIEHAVWVLRSNAVETYQSCQGGSGHSFPEPTVQFHGVAAEGFRALYFALQYNLHPTALRRVWRILEGEPTGPTWEMTFRRKF